MKIYLVGGAVRDMLLGLPVRDKDYVVVGSNFDEMIKLGFKPIGKDFPVFINPKNNFEYALARKEIKISTGHKGFKTICSNEISLKADLKRRDLTINAMAMDENGNLIDPFNGKKDLENNILRHVSNAFYEDPLRVLRVARFAARFNFKISDETIRIMEDISLKGDLNSLSFERIWTEIYKSLNEKYSYIFFEKLKECCALQKILPELNNLFLIKYKNSDYFEHSLDLLKLSCDFNAPIIVKFTLVFLYIGHYKSKLKSYPGASIRAKDKIAQICKRIKIPNKYKKFAQVFCRYYKLIFEIFRLSPKCVLLLFYRMKLINNKKFLKYIIISYRICSIHLKKEYDLHIDFIEKVYENIHLVDGKKYLCKGFSGPIIGKMIENERIEKIKIIKYSFKKLEDK